MTKEKIIYLLKQNFESLNNCKNINLYDDKGILITEDADLYFLKESKIILFTKNNEELNSYNLLRLYDFINKLGQGGFGEVHLIQQKMNKNYYTIKFLNHDFLNIKDLQFLYKEINFLMRLNHPQIIKLYSYCISTDNKLSLIMEYLSGGTLKQYIEEHNNKKLEENEAKNILSQILETVSYCHKMNIIHHDLKPENILFTDNTHKYIKIIDFGISSIINEKSSGGSLEYLPPEIIYNKNNKSSPSVDIWSIGCIFGEMLKGKVLFKGDNIEEMKKSLLNGYIELSENISNSACDLLKKMLNFEPEKRISAEEAIFHPFFFRGNIINKDNLFIRDNNLNEFSNDIINEINNQETSNNDKIKINMKECPKKIYLNKNIDESNKKMKQKKIKISFNKILNSSTSTTPKSNFLVNQNFTNNKRIEKNLDLFIKNKNINKDNCMIKSNYHTSNNSLIKEKITIQSKQKIKKEEEKNDIIFTNIKNKTIINFTSRENMAKNRLLFNLQKVENYKNELSGLKTSRYSYGHPPKKNEIEKNFKYTPDFLTKINNLTEDELISYWMKLSNKFDNEIPNYMKPIGLSRELKHKFEKLAKSFEKYSIKKIDNKNIDTYKSNKKTIKNFHANYSYKINSNIKTHTNINSYKSKNRALLNTNNKNKSSVCGKLILPNLVVIHSQKKYKYFHIK